MNKRGFTLVELLATIVIIAFVAGIAIVTYTTFVKTASDKAFESYRDSMHAEAIYYVTNYPDRITWTNNTAQIPLSNLNMEPINNPKNAADLCSSSYVDMTRTYVGNVLSITYNVCLNCPLSGYDNFCKIYEN